jgi:hypothetical protein
MRNKLFGKLDFYISSLSISSNFFFSTILIILLSIFNYLSLAAEIGLTMSFTLFLCHIFSANHRSLLYSENYETKTISIIHFRFLVSLLILVSSIFIILFFEFENKFFLIMLTILICVQWIAEIFLTIHEKKRKIQAVNYILFSNLSFFILVCIIIVFGWLNYLSFLIPIIILNYIIIFKNEFGKINLNIRNFLFFFNTLNSSIKNLEIISSFALNFSNLLWRWSIFLLAGKATAGLLFGSFAIGSFFGTVYSNVLAPKIHSNKIKIPKFIFLIIIPVMIVLLYISLKSFENFDFISEFDSARISCILFSLLGSFLMIGSLIIRFNYFYNMETKFIFKLDIIYSFIIASLILIIFNFLGSKFLVTAYLIASLSSLIIYSLVYFRK